MMSRFGDGSAHAFCNRRRPLSQRRTSLLPFRLTKSRRTNHRIKASRVTRRCVAVSTADRRQLGKALELGNDRDCEGYRAPAGVRYPPKQEAAAASGALWGKRFWEGSTGGEAFHLGGVMGR